MLQVGIIGASGYAGLELLRILAGHPEAEVTFITSRQYTGRKISDVFPAFKGVMDVCFIDPDAYSHFSEVSLVFTALPHSASMEIVGNVIHDGKKVIDMSADFRLKDVVTYEKYYGSHSAPALIEEAVYGLPELHREEIKKGRLIANPGCYATAAILGLVPLIKEKLVDIESIIIDAKSGVSGAGRVLSEETSFVEVNEGFKAYKVGEHRHTPEIEQELSLLANSAVKVMFTPHLLPISRGIFSTIYATVKEGVSEKTIRACFESTYQGERFIRILPDGEFPNISYVKGSNYCDIGIKVDTRVNRVIILTVIDNLVKGASGSAVQSMNLMHNLPEYSGLSNPFYP
jgi:N-acetyl-gamma-glutamyl-phosphate reductase